MWRKENSGKIIQPFNSINGMSQNLFMHSTKLLFSSRKKLLKKLPEEQFYFNLFLSQTKPTSKRNNDEKIV